MELLVDAMQRLQTSAHTTVEISRSIDLMSELHQRAKIVARTRWPAGDICLTYHDGDSRCLRKKFSISFEAFGPSALVNEPAGLPPDQE